MIGFAQTVPGKSASNAVGGGQPASIQALKAEGIHNLFSLGSGIYSGSAPDGKAGFAALQKLGIKTIISVDGSKPEAELAHQYGLRYVHIPIGYDGVAETNAVRLVKAAETVPGPIFVHCHHGKHRGPAAAAVICKGVEGWDTPTAMAWLKAAGTATNYTGLYQTVAQFQPPSAELLARVPADFPEQVEISTFVDAMVAIDERWDHLKSIQQAGYQTPANQPDLIPLNEAAVLQEFFRELLRSGEPQKRSDKLTAEMRAAAKRVDKLYARLDQVQRERTAKVSAQAAQAFQAVAETCAACHKVYRDPLKLKP